MIFMPILALLLGLAIGLLPSQDLKGPAGVYLAVACLAGLDTVCGGIKSNFEGRFQTDVFISGFFTNCLLAFFLAWMGDKIGVDIFLVCGIIFGQRIFNNLSLIRRHLLNSYADWKRRKYSEQPANP